LLGDKQFEQYTQTVQQVEAGLEPVASRLEAEAILRKAGMNT